MNVGVFEDHSGGLGYSKTFILNYFHVGRLGELDEWNIVRRIQEEHFILKNGLVDADEIEIEDADEIEYVFNERLCTDYQ